MIICHPLKLIFFKTKKTGGTSFEIALSKFCGPDCVITPIAAADEEMRRELRGAQNFDAPVWPDGSKCDGRFYNHMTAREARSIIPENIWESYRKITIVRDPFDAMISRYYWEGGESLGMDFGQFVDMFRSFLSENTAIAPLTGKYAMDICLRYENLRHDIEALGIDGLFDQFAAIRAKANMRPSDGTDRSKVFEAYPQAAEIVAEECRDIVQRFGYDIPRPPPTPSVSGVTRSDRYIFTLTAGRTATAWLNRFLGENLGIASIHEPTKPEDFGTRMPDIRTMRSFNNYGMVRHVRDFWTRKFDSISGSYAETNHTLAKCGLIEALATTEMARHTTLIVLRRNLADQCVSYILRGDFTNTTMEWQWYLNPAYRNNIVKPEPFLPLGPIGRAMWYCLEMETRQAFYLKKFGHRLNFVKAQLEEVVQPGGAKELLASLGHDGPVSLPERTNASDVDDAARLALKEQVEETMRGLDFDAEAIADSYIQQGRGLSLPMV